VIRKNLVRALRKFRIVHKWIGIGIAFFLLISALTGILLSLKKEFDVLQPPTQVGDSNDLADWMTLDEIKSIASTAALNDNDTPNAVERIDVRPDKGIAKVLFEDGNLEIQLDGTTGEILSVAPRYSDWIESIHDGTIISNLFSVISMNVLGWGLVVMIISGLWLWYGPIRVRKWRKKRTNS